MSEKPEALRLAQEFELHVAFGSGMTIRRTEIEAVVAQLRHLHAENERLREALEKVADASMSMHLNAAHMATSLQGIAKAALRREET